jgi:hypothetical protein
MSTSDKDPVSIEGVIAPTHQLPHWLVRLTPDALESAQAYVVRGSPTLHVMQLLTRASVSR